MVRRPTSRSCLCVFPFELKLTLNDVGVDLGRLCRLQTAVEVLCRLDIPVTEKPPCKLVFTGSVFEQDRGSRVTELMRGHSHAGGGPDALADLRAEGGKRL